MRYLAAVRLGLVVAGLVAAVSPAIAAMPPGDATVGKTLYLNKCGACHSVTANRIGPLHQGVVGRKPGSVPGYAYSPALRKLTGVWTPARLDQWLTNPMKYVPGTKMAYMVPDPVQRANIIAYLVSVSPGAAARKP